MSAMPTAPPPRFVPLPKLRETRLANGMRVIAAVRSDERSSLRIPLITALLTFDRGSAGDPPTLAGVAAMTASLLAQGTARRSALELGVAVDAIGARLDKGASFDAMSCVASATVASFPAAFDLLAEMVREPAFAGDEFERIRARSLSDLRLAYSSPSSLARLVANRAISGESEYGHPVAGTVASLSAMQREDVIDFHAHAFRPERATLIIGGDIAAEEAFDLAQRVFGDWSRDAHPDRAPRIATAPPPRRRVVAVDRPEAGRTAIAIGRLGIERASAHYYHGIVAVSALSGYSGRLNQEVRVKRGLSYGAGAQLIARRGPGLIMGSTLVDHKRTIEAVGVMGDALATLVEAPPEGAEMAARKAGLVGSFSRSIETTDGLIGSLADYALYGVPLDELKHYVERIRAVQGVDVRDFADRYIVPNPCIVLVGDISSYREQLHEISDDVTIIEGHDPDLDHTI